MTHPALEAQLDAYLDGELTRGDAQELETHLGQCAECARFRDQREALRAAIRARVPGFRASDTVRERVRGAVHAAAAAAAHAPAANPLRPARLWRPLAVAASLAVVALGSWRLALRRAGGEALADAVLASHIRSLMPGHLTDVVSSDQHTVKPWFNGKLDYSPPVYDFSGRGYPLLGGRLEYLGGRAAAALVYGRRQHVINVFLWPAERGPAGGATARSSNGYHLLHWTTADYVYWVASDLGTAELQEFVGLLQQGDAAVGTAR